MSPSKAHELAFWSEAFAGATPPSALGLALKEGLVPEDILGNEGSTWFEKWLTGCEARFHADHHPSHRPWRTACGTGRFSVAQMDASDMPPRLEDLVPSHPDAGLVAVFEGFAARNVDPFGPLPGLPHLGGDGVSAAVALNLPSAIDLLARQLRKPDPSDLDARTTPGPMLGERIALPWLHAAALAWQDTLLEALLDYGLDPNRSDSKGQTPLFYARTARAVKALMAAGADPLAKDKYNRTPLQHWKQLKDGFPWSHSADTLSGALGAAGQSAAAQANAVVLHAATSPYNRAGLKKWEQEFPQMDAPLFSARLNPGGTWKGEWSPAAWLGLQALQGKCYYFHQVPKLLEREDFLSPANAAAKGAITEWGVFGLALAKWMDKQPSQKPSESVPHHQGADGAATAWRLEQQVIARWGREWFWESPWAPSIRDTSRVLFQTRSTPRQIRAEAETAWLNQFHRAKHSPEALELALWEARAAAGVTFEEEGWGSVFSRIPLQKRAAFLLLALGDLWSSARRSSPKNAQVARDALEYGTPSRVFRELKSTLRATGGALEKPDVRLDAALEAVLSDLAAAGVDDEGLSLLRAHRLEKSLEPSSGSRPRVRM